MSDNTSPEPVEISEELVLELNFVPSWARKPPSAGRANAFSDHEDRKDRHQQRKRSDGRARTGPGGRDRGRRGDRRSDPRAQAARGGRPADRGSRSQRGPRDQRDTTRKPVPVVISVLPKFKGVSIIMAKIQKEKRAYPLKIVADTFLTNPDFCEIRVESRNSGVAPEFYHCRKCKIAALDRATIQDHALTAHFDEYFDREEEECEPPSGQFPCVARCGLSGILLGAPNHHSYSERVREIRQGRFKHMSEEEYRSHIEMVRNPEIVAKWKEESSRRTVYYEKSDKDRKNGMKWLSAESLFNSRVMPGIVRTTRRSVFPASLIKTMEDKDLQHAVRQAGRREVQRPRSMMSALRTAFRKRGLFLIKIGKGETFVTGVQPCPLDPEQTVESIREVLVYLKEHPGCKREQMISDLLPDKAADSAEAAELLKPLNWLIEKGHIIQFFDGALAVPLR